MNKVTQYYREVIANLKTRLKKGERNLDNLISNAGKQPDTSGHLTGGEVEQITAAIRRDLQEFVRNCEESKHEASDSVFMRMIKESLWQELADITDKTQLEWREIFKDVNHHGVYSSGEVVGLGNLICEKCHCYLAVYTPVVLPPCRKCGHNQFTRRPFEP